MIICREGTTNSGATAIWIINEQNSTPINIDVYQPIFQIMWYRFLLVIIIFVTIAGNILVCLAIARERKLQNTTNYFLMSLAIADCLVAILVMPMGMVAEVLGHFPLPHYACIIFATMDVLCCTSSIWHMSTMSMDRYFTIRFPFRYGRNKTRRIMLLKIIAVWAISTAISSPVFVLGIVDKQNVLSNGVCAPNNESFKLYGSVFAFYIPFIIMITTYALTMRSLRNVLVNKRKFNREKRRQQTFQPFLQITNQYAESARNIRHTSATDIQTTTTTTTTTNNDNNNNNNNNSNNSHLNSTSCSLISTGSSKDLRTQSFLLNNSDLSRKLVSNNIQYGSMSMTNRTNINNEFIHHINQHLTINYTKRNTNKKRYQYQQQEQLEQQQNQQSVILNTGINRIKYDPDMSTVFEITEYLKPTSNSYNVTSNIDISAHQQSIVSNEQKQQPVLNIVDNQEEQQLSNTVTTTSTIHAMSPPEVDIYSTTDMENRTETTEINSQAKIFSTSCTPSALLIPIQTISFTIPWQYYFTMIEYVLQYYIFIYPYRLRPLAIEYEINKNELDEKSFQLHQSTSASSINSNVTKTSQSVSTQTNSFPPFDITSTHETNTNDTYLYNSIKQPKFSFNRPILSSSSFFTRFLRQTPATLPDAHVKSSASLDQHSLRTSSPSDLTHQQDLYHHPQHSSSAFHSIECETYPILENDHRPRAASSSSAQVRTTNQRANHGSLRCHRPLKRGQPFQSRSAYFLTYSNSHGLRRQQQQQPLSSTTNTNSSDSLSIFHRLNSKYFSAMSHQQQQHQNYSQRIRDEHIVAANERKALRVLLIIFCVFVTLWTPFFICTFISAVCEECRERITSTMWFSITWLGYSSSMANPFIYTIFSDVFRRAFTNILFCRPSDSLFQRQFSTKLTYKKNTIAHPSTHRQLSHTRSPNHEYSRTSTPISLHHQTSIGGSDATIYINRCISDTFR
ncbi:unnamed protein product [Rotaria magnacalcarata]|uniref:G-protein coupled receptors family 1 profile domain-containing protein n=2 Tax=Rotaria magnacalcarata TaxID=392030 RepID=A0A816T8Y2_9BILA|nr:unnamed protein product [Rotaria magnacalcarata]